MSSVASEVSCRTLLSVFLLNSSVPYEGLTLSLFLRLAVCRAPPLLFSQTDSVTKSERSNVRSLAQATLFTTRPAHLHGTLILAVT